MRVIHSRIIVVNVVLVLAAVLAFAASITIGDHPITLEKVFEVFMGGGTRLQRTVVLKWRLHRAVAAVAVGLALGLAGALTQSVTRNPLASPDVLGISQGASACAVTIIVLGSGTMGAVSLPVAALIGSTLAAVVIWLLGSRRGMDTFRLVLSGIMITALLQSYITWLLLRADISDAAIAKTWLTGSLVASSANRNLPVLLVLALIVPIIGYMAFQLRAMTLGDDMAAGLGVSVDKHKALFLLVSVVLTAVAVSAAADGLWRLWHPSWRCALWEPPRRRWLVRHSAARHYWRWRTWWPGRGCRWNCRWAWSRRRSAGHSWCTFSSKQTERAQYESFSRNRTTGWLWPENYY